MNEKIKNVRLSIITTFLISKFDSYTYLTTEKERNNKGIPKINNN